MKREPEARAAYRQPQIETFEAVKILESLGPVSAGSGDPCDPLLGNFGLC